MAEQDSTPRILAALEAQLEQSRQQQTRLKEVLTRLLLVLEHDGAG
ncbi:MAG TPA: hypothetical protein VHN36_16530 [Ilumatobacteraceae bacterium]|nr:hypothetical protein [Ilumatobacteraceae bacterium]